ncbi:UDP-N-acetylmuramoyl-tripeptide--D-alanyl-D-alanine ligase [Bacillus sp. ISL-35]|uniref:UDP-N-acetylmuramoyl-tripeptide--D-alanyl-D- alanine ligase n=1 Tax=Bacillus sp. ISL-35 TaxID=2819122 RepID=UPI001BEC4AE7|nr:UDP-N-acetylmuramoyl-tripeptide--D-alanyl-D-alanine ligase [Bacillus sp. ISL-35]MBT2681579.1 UDP-N-acetylmuramoyl-tripeptide--D-alanyl-D-alanine ligase [Bacillus sp. ISL-35]MBT2706017.1 UDP-N-acetylmuramoyl-tripeptide--D-alanyl-D-alanine ligase [Chryseobacterium sp. ISL-80]
MIQKTLAQIAKMAGGLNDVSKFADVEIKGVSIDTRKIEAGNLFVPFKGARTDGHKFVADVIQNGGASAALWQKDVPNPPEDLPVIIVEDTTIALQELARSYRNSLDIKVVGITGSNGKTTTKDMTANLLAQKYKVQKTEGNFNNHLGLPLTLLRLQEDTEVAVLEMGMSSKGEIEFLTKLGRPDAVIITNIGESHLLDLGSREAIADAKLEIITGLQENGLIIFHGDEPLLQERLQDYKGNGVLKTFGASRENDLYPVEIEPMEDGNKFTTNIVSDQFYLPVLGNHNILNALAAMLAAEFLGVPFEKMNDGFASLKLTNMRMELSEGAHGEKIINDAYNASPTSMNAAIDLVANLSGHSRKILVLGDMLELGPLEEEYHYKVGTSLDAAKVDYVFTYGKLSQSIARGAKEVLGENRAFAFDDKQQLSEELKKYVTDETIVLVKASRGMALEEVVQALQK